MTREELDAALEEWRSTTPHQPSGPLMRAFIQRLLPVVQFRVGRKLLGESNVSPTTDQRDEILQLVLVRLFRDDAANFDAWDDSKGLSLENWVGKSAEWVCTDELQRQGRLVRQSVQEPPEFFDHLTDGLMADADLTLRDLWEEVRRRTLAGLAKAERIVFGDFFDEGLSTGEVASRHGLTPDAAAKRKSRILGRVRDIAEQLLGRREH